MRNLVLATTMFFSFFVFSQPYQVGHRQKTFTDASRNNRTITTEIYYPSSTTGDNVPISAGQFPVLVFGHGFVMAWSAYDVVWSALVPSGYIMVFPTTETSFSPSHAEFGKDIAFLVGAMKTESLNSSSPFFNSNTGTSAVMGHSMGGGAAFLSVQHDNTINVLATLAAANTNPSSIGAASGINIPSIVFSGANDCVTPPQQHQVPMYDSLSSNCKTFISITGGSHCQFASVNFNCYLGEGTCSPQAAVSATSQQTTVKNILLPWLDFYLKGSCPSGTQFQNLLSANSGITHQQNCTLVCNNVTSFSSEEQVLLYPNPTEDEAIIKTIFTSGHEIKYILENQMGERVETIVQENNEEVKISTKKLTEGVYFIKVYNANRLIALKKLVITRH